MSENLVIQINNILMHYLKKKSSEWKKIHNKIKILNEDRFWQHYAEPYWSLRPKEQCAPYIHVFRSF